MQPGGGNWGVMGPGLPCQWLHVAASMHCKKSLKHSVLQGLNLVPALISRFQIVCHSECFFILKISVFGLINLSTSLFTVWLAVGTVVLVFA